VDTAEHGLEAPERLRALLAAGFHVALGQGPDDEHARGHLGRLGQRLNEGEHRLEPVVQQLPGVGDQLIEQDHARAGQPEEFDELL